jgi:hypothetical protein
MNWYDNNFKPVLVAGATTPNETPLIWERDEYVTYEIGSLKVRFFQSKQVYTLGAGTGLGYYIGCNRELKGQWDMPGGVNYIVEDLHLNDNFATQPSACWSEPFEQPKVDMRFIPAILIGNKDRSDPAQNAYCDNQVVRLAVTYHGTDGDYDGMANYTGWQYRVDNGDFHPIVMNYYNQDDWDHGMTGREASFTLRDIFGADYPNYLNKRIEFRATASQRYMYADSNDDTELRPMSKPDEGSNVLAYYFYRSTPEPSAVAAVNPPCVNGSSNALNITFDRGLLSGEQITAISLFKKVNGSWDAYGQMQSPITALAPGNAFSWTNIQRPMDAGEYYMNIEGIISGQPTCNSANYFFTVTTPPPVTFSIADKKEVSCYGGSDGSISITGAGGAGGYYYSKDNGASWQNTSNVFDSLPKGTYTILVKDLNNCTASASQTVTIGEPATALSVGVTNYIDPRGAATNDGQVQIAASGGTAPYTYAWSNGAVTQHLQGLGGGTYAVTVTDSHNCTATANVSLVAPDSILITFTETPVSCQQREDGVLTATVSGGLPPYTYNWSGPGSGNVASGLGAGTYSLEITDANNVKATLAYELKEPAVLEAIATATPTTCSYKTDGSIITAVAGGTTPYTYRWSNDAITPQQVQLAAGKYYLTVTDARNCTAMTDAIVGSPAALQMDGIINPPSRYGSADGSIVPTIDGGTVPYTYSWNTGETTKDLQGLAMADYTLTVTDNNNCTESHTFQVKAPDPLTLGITRKAIVSCHGLSNGRLTADVGGGTAPFSYQWSDGSTTPEISGLPAGTYKLKVTDRNGVEAEATYTLDEPPLLELSLTTSEVSCGSQKDGAVRSTTNGGVKPYAYSWNTGAVTPDLVDVNGGMYTLHVTDANGCILSASATITAPNALSLSGAVVSPTCNGYDDGAIDLTLSGGRTPYYYEWSNGATTEDLSSLSAGDYTVRMTDNSGCLVTRSFTLYEPAALHLELGPDHTLCAGQSLSLDAGIPGGVTYNWSSPNGFNASTPVVTVGETGTYTVTAYNANGCSATDALTIQKEAGEIGADFLMSTQGYSGESIIAVNVSSPAADRVEWTLPPAARVVSKSDHLVEMVFDQPGHYELAMTTYRGNCEASTVRDVMIVDGVQLPDVNTQHNSLFAKTVIRPNPNNGQFYLDVTVTEDITVNYRFLDVQRNRVVYERKEQLSKAQLISSAFNIPGLSAGVYVLLIESVKEKKALKVLIL